MSAGAARTIDHVIVAVSDLVAAERTFEALLGRAAAWAGSHPGLGTANVLFRIDNTYIELIAAVGEGSFASLVKSHLAANGEGLIGCAFGTDDASALAARLRTAGFAAADSVGGEGKDERTGAVRAWKNVMIPLDASRRVLVFGIEHLSSPDALPVSPAKADRGTLNELDHVVLHTGNPEAAIKLYGEGFGLRLALDKAFPQWGSRLQFFRAAGVSFEVASSLEGGDATTDRLNGFCFRTDDIDAAHVRLSRARLDVSEVRDGRKPGTKVFTVRSGTCGVPTLVIMHPKA